MTIESIIAALATGGRHLGDICFWLLSDASVDRATFEFRWAASGLDPALLPEPPTPEKEARVSLDRALGSLASDQPKHEVVQSITAKFAMLRNTHGADDVRRTITRTLASFSAVTLRESGGIYWVPAPYAKQLRQLQACIERVGRKKPKWSGNFS